MTIDLKQLGIEPSGAIHYNLSMDDLRKRAIEEGAKITKTGALWRETGERTGRSANDKFIVEDAITKDSIDWGKVNKPVSEEVWDKLYSKITAYLSKKDKLYVLDAEAGADSNFARKVRIVEEHASQVFFLNLLLREAKTLDNFTPDFTLICASDCQLEEDEQINKGSNTFILVNFTKKIVIIGGTHYAGERKKSVFSFMNVALPDLNVLPMHSSANVGKDGRAAIFFGLSGTGKTTLSADDSRSLIGDDEHGWTPDDTVFNIEGGCYAKGINLEKEKEPVIWNAIGPMAMVENATINEDANELGLDFFDTKTHKTENSRIAYDLSVIPNLVKSGVGKDVKTVVYLTADAYGVLPAISKLSREQAMYHYLSGYTSKLAGTEIGVTEPTPTFSAYFGAPFFALKPMTYANLLAKRLEENPDVSVFLLNTGWNGTGDRMSLKDTRAMLNAALDGKLDDVEFVEDPIFKVQVPQSCPDISDQSILNPKSSWTDEAAYFKKANELAAKFQTNSEKLNNVDEKVLASGPAPIAVTANK